MKKMMVVLVLFVLLIMGCGNPVQNNIDQNTPAPASGMGTVTISLAESPERTLLPDNPGEFSSYWLNFQYQGEDESLYSKEDKWVTPDSLPFAANLEPGPWLITVGAYVRVEGVEGIEDSNYLAAMGSVTVNVVEGSNVAAAVDLSSGVDIGGDSTWGVFEYDIGLTGDDIFAAHLNILDMDGNPVQDARYYMNGTYHEEYSSSTRDLLTAPAGTIVLRPGYYLLQIQLTTGRVRSRTEVLHIYSGHTTRAEGASYHFSTEEGIFFNVQEVSEYLAALPPNTAETPYTVKLMADLQTLSTETQYVDVNNRILVLGALDTALQRGRYVNLDLSAASGEFKTYTTDPNNGNYYSGGFSYNNGEYLADVTLPENLSFIPPYTFSGTSLSSIDLPDSISSIGTYAFSNCWSLETVDLSNCTKLSSIGNNAFSECRALKTIDLPDSINGIGTYAFSYCQSLETVDLSNCTELASIGEHAFYQCRSLKRVDLSACGEITSVGNYIFDYCTSLKDVLLPMNFPISYGTFDNCTSLDSLAFTGTQTALSINNNSYTWVKTVDLSACTNMTTLGEYVFSGWSKLETVILPDTLTSIETGAFANCTALTVLPEMPTVEVIANAVFANCTGLSSALDLSAYISLLTLGDDAFSGCTQITSIVLPASLQTIGKIYSDTGITTELTTIDLSDYTSLKTINETFRDFAKLETVILPEGLENIGDYSFYNCATLTEINFPKTLKTIGQYAFSGYERWTETGYVYNTPQLTALDLSNSSLTSIGDYAFGYCNVLTTLNLSGCTALESLGNLVFSGCPAVTMVDLSGCTSLKTINETFRDFTKLETVILPEGLENIGDYSFYNCAALTEINLPKTLKTIGKYAFSANETWTGSEYVYNAPQLTELDLSNSSLTSIGDSAFQYNKKLETVNFTGSVLTVMGNYTFGYCDVLTTLNLSGCTALESLGNLVFSGSPAVTTVDLSGCTSLKTINETFRDFAKLETVILPEGLENIGDYSFYNCVALMEINFPKTLKSIGNSAFQYNRKLETVDFTGSALAVIGNNAFQYCDVLTMLNLSGCTALESIGDYAFGGYYEWSTEGAAALTSLNLSDCIGLVKIGNYAFNQCVALAAVDLSGCTALDSIGDYVFNQCAVLTTVDLSDCTSLTVIGNYAFNNCAALETLNLSACTALKTIGDNTFSSCVSLAAVDLSDCTSLIGIGNYAFSSCTSLLSLDLSGSGSLTSIGSGAFQYCNKLGEVDFSACSALANIGDSAFNGCSSFAPAYLSGCTALKTIGNAAFAGCYGLPSLDLSNCTLLASIGDSAFSSWNNLESIDLSGCTLLVTIGNSAFNYCYKLQSVDLSGCGVLTGIGDSTFYNCSTLQTVNLSGCDSLTKIGNNAFQYCYALTTVNFPVTVLTTIGDSAFASCYNLIIDFSVFTAITGIGNEAFSGCSSLTVVDLSAAAALKSIGISAFSGTSLTKAVLSNCTALISIGNSAFSCSTLTEVHLAGINTPPELKRQYTSEAFNHFGAVRSELIIYVPVDKVDAYKSAATWATYADNIQAVTL